MQRIQIAFQKIYKKFKIEAYYTDDKDGNAEVIIYHDEKKYQSTMYPSYKVYNLAAHFEDIVDQEIKNKPWLE